MDITDWIALTASILALLTTVIGWIFQYRGLRQRDIEIKHRLEMDQKEFVEKYASHEKRMQGWLEDLDEPPELASDPDQTDTGLPYQAGAPIRTPDLFYGRNEDLNCVMDCITGKQMASMFVLGARKSGKTSFFYHLSHILDTDHYPQFVPVYLDAQSAISSEKNFFAYMLREASAGLDARNKTTARPPDIPKEIEYEILANFLEKAGQKQWRFLFMLDEFERLVNAPETFGDNFFSNLRSLILKGKMSWITASFREVYIPGTSTSPFHNIVQDIIHLGPLNEEEAFSLAAEPAARAGHPFELEEVDLILTLAGRMPFLIQKAALLLYKAHRSGITGSDARVSLTNRFKLETETYFNSQIALLSDQESQALSQLTLGKDVTAYEPNLELLEKYGFVESDGNDFRVLGQTFNEYLLKKARTASFAIPGP